MWETRPRLPIESSGAFNAGTNVATLARTTESNTPATGVEYGKLPRMKPLHTFVVIPARLASTRLPRKLLLAETGKPLIQHTYEAASRARKPAGLLVAADHEEIAAAVRGFHGRVVMTSPACASGTDRVAEVARAMPDVDVFVNVQGDEPEISAAAIDLAVELLQRDPKAAMSTLATPIRERARLEDPSCVKVVFDDDHRGLYFSRAPIPFARTWDDALLQSPRQASISTSACTPIAASSC